MEKISFTPPIVLIVFAFAYQINTHYKFSDGKCESEQKLKSTYNEQKGNKALYLSQEINIQKRSAAISSVYSYNDSRKFTLHFVTIHENSTISKREMQKNSFQIFEIHNLFLKPLF